MAAPWKPCAIPHTTIWLGEFVAILRMMTNHEGPAFDQIVLVLPAPTSMRRQPRCAAAFPNPVAASRAPFIVTETALYRTNGVNVPVNRPSVPEDFWTPHLHAVAGSPPNRSAKSSAFLGSRKQK
jgi:hypothetical protein